jgi:cyclopropane fatty-acyl-phospholipid synthase-like methyltransferase
MKKYLRMPRLGEDVVRRTLRLNDSAKKLERDAQEFWSRPINDRNSFWWHARGSEPFKNADNNWLRIGDRHVSMYREFARSLGRDPRVDTLVDWGCGGGANAIAFAGVCNRMWGTDISADALAECDRQVKASEHTCEFNPVKVEVGDPEAALKAIPSNVDVFHCLYVFEVFPTQEYGARILRLAHQMLKPGGICFIQIKYVTDSLTSHT